MNTLKKVLITLCLTLTGFLPATHALAANATLSLSPSTLVANKGCTFSLDVIVDTGGIATDGTDAIIFYDTTRFQASQIHNGTIYADYPGNSIDPTNGQITVSGLSSLSSPFSGKGTLATVDFTVLSAAPEGASQITFDFDPQNKSKTTDSNIAETKTVADILNDVTNSTVTVGSGTCGSFATSPTPPQGGDGDVIVTKSPLPTKAPLPKSADFNTTFVVGVAGSILVILGILGLVVL